MCVCACIVVPGGDRVSSILLQSHVVAHPLLYALTPLSLSPSLGICERFCIGGHERQKQGWPNVASPNRPNECRQAMRSRNCGPDVSKSEQRQRLETKSEYATCCMYIMT